jgi:CBS domain-containing protein
VNYRLLVKEKTKLKQTFYPIKIIFFLKVMPKVKDFMTKGVLTIDAEKTVFEAAELMSQKEVGDVVVLNGEIPRGIVTERDFVRRVVAKKISLDTKVSDVMSKPLITISPEASLKEAARKMVNNRIRRLPVVKQHKLVGIIAVSDFARHLSKKTLTEGILEAIWRHPVT